MLTKERKELVVVIELGIGFWFIERKGDTISWKTIQGITYISFVALSMYQYPLCGEGYPIKIQSIDLGSSFLEL